MWFKIYVIYDWSDFHTVSLLIREETVRGKKICGDGDLCVCLGGGEEPLHAAKE